VRHLLDLLLGRAPGRVAARRCPASPDQDRLGRRKVSRKRRRLLLAAGPVFGLWLVIAGPLGALGRNLALDDLPSREEEELSDAWPGLDEAVLDAWDQTLCQELEWLAAGADPVTVGVCWGAGHMRAVIALLHTRLGYRIVSTSWMTVFGKPLRAGMGGAGTGRGWRENDPCAGRPPAAPGLLGRRDPVSAGSILSIGPAVSAAPAPG
jgi:hypothetical protein